MILIEKYPLLNLAVIHIKYNILTAIQNQVGKLYCTFSGFVAQSKQE